MMEGHQLDVRESYERTRLGSYLSTIVHLSKKDQQSLTPQKLFKFEWEKEIKESVESIEADKNHFKNIRRLIKEGKVKPKDNGKSKN